MKQQEEEMKLQYQKEQEIYKAKLACQSTMHNTTPLSFTRELMGKAHPMSFMYDPPPGYKPEEDKVSD